MKTEKSKKDVCRRFLDGVYTQSEAEQIMQEIHDDTSVAPFDELAEEVWIESENYSTASLLEHEAFKNEAAEILRKLKRQKLSYSIRKVMTFAASVAAVVVIVWGASFLSKQMKTDQPIYVEVITSFGEKKSVTLPDGTWVVLNSCSHIKFPKSFKEDPRCVSLEGEAYFNVMRNEEKPFIVNTKYFDIQVLGTSFNIKSYLTDEIVSVSVDKGKVQVDLPEAMFRLGANEQAVMNVLSEEYTKRKEERDVSEWIRGTLYFSRTPIRDVARELERAYNCSITFNDKQEFNNLISGEHDNKSLEAVLQSLEYISGIKYNMHGREIFFYK